MKFAKIVATLRALIPLVSNGKITSGKAVDVNASSSSVISSATTTTVSATSIAPASTMVSSVASASATNMVSTTVKASISTTSDTIVPIVTPSTINKSSTSGGSAAGPSSDAQTIDVTPHDMYSSSIGVLGCTVNTNRVAYLPKQPGCDNLCWKFSHNGRSVHLLHVDTSSGAWDISYDAWNYLSTGSDAASAPSTGGSLSMQASVVSMDQCQDIITSDDGRIGFMATSPNFVNSCKASSPGSFVAKNFQLWNFGNSCCSVGAKAKCDYDDATHGASADCEGTKLGVSASVKTAVKNVLYGSGKEIACV